MRLLRHQRGYRRIDADRRPFAFFVVGAVVVLAVVFVIGLQVGRYVERRSGAAVGEGGRPGGTAPPAGKGASPQAEIRNELNAFSEDASKVPAVQPQTAKEDLAQTEKETTFRRTLAGKEAASVPLSPRASGVRQAPSSSRETAGKKVYTVQAGAFKERKAADAVRERLVKRGLKASVSKPSAPGRSGGRLFRVIVGPFSDKEEAGKAMRKIRSEMKINAVLASGPAR